MFKIKFSYFVTAFVAVSLSLLAGNVRADVFLYEDPDYNFVFSVPDSWDMQTVTSPLTRVSFKSPVVDDHAFCEVETKEEGRYKIYPKRLMEKVTEHYFNADFWKGEISRRFLNPYLFHAKVNSGLDKSDASMAQVSYDMIIDPEKEPVKMYATLIASVYGDTRYVMTCSSTYDSYSKWSDLFGSIFSSMTLDDRYSPIPTGYYRNFLADKEKSIRHPGLGDISR